MFKNEDYERLLVKYTSQGLPAGESLQHFCDRMKVPYNLFNKWYRDTRHKVVPVAIDGLPAGSEEEPSLMDSVIDEAVHTAGFRAADTTSGKEKPVVRHEEETAHAEEAVCSESGPFIMIDLRTTSGLQIRRRGMTYPQFLEFAKNLRALC